jgi:hypothetical protein
MRFLPGCLFVAVAVVLFPGPAISARAGDAHAITDTPQTVPLPRPVRRARGSSSPSPVPPYQSTVTPLGVAPQVVAPYPIDRSVSPPFIAPHLPAFVGAPVYAPPPAVRPGAR